ncbi:MAG: methyltransferase [SAR202 cluster bacterium]|nr:methyltransferase [SAR202 cluster bacterium]MDP7104784.1 methyltransferase [SAR202 cluster bacterium]MDP7226431.1 methyltransferase [SAR202 cluster bacterium]MDP7413582.1 methyltransferase [SAR202 cluster bacterium]HJO81502.1 methyltransferase [SAR202 cluster bacterium]
MLDAGGGSGGVAIVMTEIWPEIHATVAELPLATPITEKVVEEESAGDRVGVVTADVTRESIPGAYDVAIVKALLQTLSPDGARVALGNISESINPSGRIFIIGSILDDSRTFPSESVLFNLNVTNIYDVGESYTEQMHRNWLADAGFADIERAAPLRDGRSGLMTARKRG